MPNNKFLIVLLICWVWIVSLFLIRPNPKNVAKSLYYDKSEKYEVAVADLIAKAKGTGASAKIQESEKQIVQSDEGVQIGRMKAVFVVLVRNKELEKWLASMRELEDRFNREYNYPYVFLNDQNFTQEFKERVQSHTKAKVEFGLIPKEHWGYPDFINQDRTKKNLKESKGKMDYGDSESYRNMCRFESGFFFRHPLLQKYKWYWRVEPDVHFPCDIDFDPFQYLADNNKKYGFTITMREAMITIPTLWKTVNKFIEEKNLKEKIPKDNSEWFITDDDSNDYNGCHFWTNFEIASLDLWRDKQYLEFFEYLDRSGGFFYERWGDAPVHSIYTSLFLKKSEVHFFDEIGYTHDGLTHCPSQKALQQKNCHCDVKKSLDNEGYSCNLRWLENIEMA